jgi:hypothetical protein
VVDCDVLTASATYGAVCVAGIADNTDDDIAARLEGQLRVVDEHGLMTVTVKVVLVVTVK